MSLRVVEEVGKAVLKAMEVLKVASKSLPCFIVCIINGFGSFGSC